MCIMVQAHAFGVGTCAEHLPLPQLDLEVWAKEQAMTCEASGNHPQEVHVI